MDKEAGLHHVARFLHIVADGVVLQQRGAGLRIDAGAELVGQGVAVVRLDGVPSRHAGEDELAAAAVAREKMGGDAVHEDDFVRFRHVLVDPHRRAELRRAHEGEAVLIAAVVLDEADAARYFFAHHADVFFMGLSAVRALREDDGDVFIGNARQIQLIHHMDDELIGMIPCAGHVGADDADFIAFLHHFLKRSGTDGMTHTLDGRFLHVHSGRGIAFDHIGNVFFRKHDGLRARAETEFEFFQCHSITSL